MPYICLLQNNSENLQKFIEKAQNNSYTAIAAPINCTEVPIEFKTEPLKSTHTDCSYSDLILNADVWNGKVITLLSDTIDCDSKNLKVRQNSEEILKKDLSWTEHLHYGGYTMLRLKSDNNINLARVVSRQIKGVILVQIPLVATKIASTVWRSDISDEVIANYQNEDTWKWWNRFRWAADFNPKIRVVLELGEDRPSKECVRRWLGEPLEALIIPSSLFIRNRHNYPVLPKAWQELIALFLTNYVNFIVSADQNDNSLKQYAEYLNNLRETNVVKYDLQNFEDVLEIPLQPLYDNLDCYTYETFEKDPVKYKLYQDAIEAALVDRVPEEEIEKTITTVMVLGAGRGPLVRSALNAAENTKRKIRVYIIEKNPNAVRTLTAITRKLWSGKDIQIFSKDMREFTPPEKGDILVSELLGSFGDNELSPECLDCAQILLKDNGISIPCKSTSYINPLMSSKLYNSVRSIVNHKSFQRDMLATYSNHSESGFVVLLKNVYHIGHPQALFEFHHPNRDEIIDNSRYKMLSFDVTQDCVLNGIAGYFDTVLYKDIKISINPPTHTPGMMSWFPMYFPFIEPIDLKAGEVVEINFWRCVSKQKIWYEWNLSSPRTTHIHNHNGRSCPIYCT